MGPTLVATIAVAALAALGAAVSWRLARASIWRHLRRFAGVAALTSLFSLLDVAGQLAQSQRALVVLSSLLGATSVLLCWAWLRYTEELCHREPNRAERWLGHAILLIAAVDLIPGVVFDVAGPSHPHAGAADPAWRHADLTGLGVALSIAVVGAWFLVAARLLVAWRAGKAGAGAIALSILVALPLGVLDVSEHAGWSDAPHLIGLGLAIPLGVAAWIVASQFLADAEQLHALRQRLEGLVEERTRELAEANAALLQAEKLAALGQFAAGVAHEVNNPASVATSNLSLLSAGLARGEVVPEERELIEDSLEAMRRINELVRKLLDAGRLADLPPGSGNVPLASAVARTFAELRAHARPEIDLVNAVPDDLIVRGGPDVVGRIVASLVANAIESIPQGRKGRVEVTARANDHTVRLVVQDDGAGMPVDVLRRAFDPFFTTKPQGRGSGLGLPITRGLVEGIGGQIWLESEPHGGTRAAVELPVGMPA